MQGSHFHWYLFLLVEFFFRQEGREKSNQYGAYGASWSTTAIMRKSFQRTPPLHFLSPKA
jgi:hypothetical protein